MATLMMVAGMLGYGLYYFNQNTINLFQRYKKLRDQDGGAPLSYPIEFQRPPKQIWQDLSDLIYQPGMPEGQGSQLPIDGQFSDQGIFGAPKVNFLKDNIYYQCYRPECLYI